ncbi:phosphatase methylesterase 1 [Brachionus plicatilis]|uniref:Protein phosphatase methylesterase 1 n=1 Tax=Brachionus plicatilis TaxID=10195 RepID=A0A3M7PE76_BRAPC|nr:phosphatase methylesterase 1 [Brachionus plicatilis]
MVNGHDKPLMKPCPQLQLNACQMSHLHKKVITSSPGMGGLPPRAPHDHSRRVKNKRDYTPVPWTNYFDRSENVQTNQGKNRFRVYIKGSSGPVVFFLHGGGFSGLTWSLLSATLTGQVECQCYSLDIRGHGDTHTEDDEDLSIDTMARDVKEVIETIWKEDCPPIMLVGHSMGGALAVHVSHLEFVKNLAALVVIDVVEGSAMEALSGMQTFLQGRPKFFSSVQQAIEYNVRIGAIRNAESARVSIVGQLKKVDNASQPTQTDVLVGNQSHEVMNTEILEEDEDGENNAEQSEPEAHVFSKPESVRLPERYEWRIDLTRTEKFWKDWFKGLSCMFLNVHVPKLLLLAGVDRLDKDLMVGQMQGKFQMQILPLCGHAVHEDAPEDVADALANFMLRHKLTNALEWIKPARLTC